jgi:hypothetical protein
MPVIPAIGGNIKRRIVAHKCPNINSISYSKNN